MCTNLAILGASHCISNILGFSWKKSTAPPRSIPVSDRWISPCLKSTTSATVAAQLMKFLYKQHFTMGYGFHNILCLHMSYIYIYIIIHILEGGYKATNTNSDSIPAMSGPWWCCLKYINPMNRIFVNYKYHKPYSDIKVMFTHLAITHQP